MLQTTLETMGDSGSDHAIQGLEVTDSAHPNLIIRGLSHNMLDKCFDEDNCPIKDHHFTNNPFNENETDEQYLARKDKQLKQYLKLIDKFASQATPLDFILLQETDIFHRDFIVAPEHRQKRSDILTSFYDTLAEKGWAYTMVNPADNCKHLVTLYNSNSIAVSRSHHTFMRDRRSKNTALELKCTHLQSNVYFKLTNVHLDFELDASTLTRRMLRYLNCGTKNNKLIIVGGDCNKPRDDIIGALGPQGFATSLRRDTDGKVTSRMEDNKPNTIDSFFVGPSSPSSKITAKPFGCFFFNRNSTLKRYHSNGMPFTSPQDGWPVMSEQQHNDCIQQGLHEIFNPPKRRVPPRGYLQAQPMYYDPYQGYVYPQQRFPTSAPPMVFYYPQHQQSAQFPGQQGYMSYHGGGQPTPYVDEYGQPTHYQHGPW